MFIPPLSIERPLFMSKAVDVSTKAIVKSCKAKCLQSIRNQSLFCRMSICPMFLFEWTDIWVCHWMYMTLFCLNVKTVPIRCRTAWILFAELRTWSIPKLCLYLFCLTGLLSRIQPIRMRLPFRQRPWFCIIFKVHTESAHLFTSLTACMSVCDTSCLLNVSIKSLVFLVLFKTHFHIYFHPKISRHKSADSVWAFIYPIILVCKLNVICL